MNKQLIFTALAGIVGGLGAGLSCGFVLARKQLEATYAEESRREIAQAKEFYKKLHKQDEFDSPESTVKALGLDAAVEALTTYKGISIKEEDLADVEPDLQAIVDHELKRAEHEEVLKNIFYGGATGDFDAYMKTRDVNKPHIISREEFLENENGYDQSTITYYEEDGVLADERDKPIELELVVGSENLNFGFGSGDINVVYVRNERLGLEVEIARSEGSFAKLVYGFTDEETRTKRRPRGDDE